MPASVHALVPRSVVPSSRELTCRPFATSGRRAPLLLALALSAVAAPVWAATTAGSQAYGVAADLHVAPAHVIANPTPLAAGQAPPAYDRHEQVASATVETSLGTFAGTGLVEAAARSEVPAAASTSAAAVIHDADALQGGLVQLAALEIRSSSEIAGACGSGLTAIGTTTLSGAQLFIGGALPTAIDLASSPAPNTVAFDQLGVRVVLNERSQAGTGTSSASISVNAVHVYLTGYLVGGQLLSGDLVLGHSEAAVQCDTAAAPADLAVVQSVDQPRAVPRHELRYEIHVTNTGPGAAAGVVATDELPAEVVLLASSPSQGACTGAQQVSCALGTLAAGSGATIQIRVRVGDDAAGTIANRVEAGSAVPDPDMADNVSMLLTPVDRDGDGDDDGGDNCVATANPGQEDGDGDGRGDACDNCPAAANSGQADADGDGLGDACDIGDQDDDGVPDQGDNCPAVANSNQADADGDGIGDACDECPEAAGACDDGDGDGDGVPDGRDNCPGIANSGQQDADRDGTGDACEAICPQVEPATADALLLAGGRFRAELTWKTPSGLSGRGRGRTMTEKSGYFWFFDPADTEVVVRVHDACAPPFNHFWVFASGLTNLEVTLTVTDLATGRRWTYANPQGHVFAPALDTAAFHCGS